MKLIHHRGTKTQRKKLGDVGDPELDSGQGSVPDSVFSVTQCLCRTSPKAMSTARGISFLYDNVFSLFIERGLINGSSPGKLGDAEFSSAPCFSY